ncbi:uridine diphosphate-N-acetylglucosamine-binding protein YvcK [Erysipelothrix urinaevulpis]|uniref:gluconeogenesis factor YvcK family protein n=1 Tax=Erysipelothrix urinaevulpis TaxID=2683717 RepID=UPI001359122C|nr:uridine diphosphate-N-acetylglucosamine-binding protein YvcK [Erysipelothrix urinaevulpis]
MKVVVIGGGKGQSTILRGLKKHHFVELSAIVTVADDGGSTGRLREDFDMPAMGDVRNVIMALAESETILNQVMDFRFKENSRSDLAGHSLGNLILTALTETTGDFTEAIASMSSFLNVEGNVIPSSPDSLTLVARMQDGTIVRGESNIPEYKNSIKHVYYDQEVQASTQAIEAIMNADVIIFGIGSIYTSILPNIIIPGIKNALSKTNAKFVYYCNVMTQPGETDGFTVRDHIQAIETHGNIEIDAVVLANDQLPPMILDLYIDEGSTPVNGDVILPGYTVIHQELLDFDGGVIRHDSQKVYQGFAKVLEAIECPLAVK